MIKKIFMMTSRSPEKFAKQDGNTVKTQLTGSTLGGHKSSHNEEKRLFRSDLQHH